MKRISLSGHAFFILASLMGAASANGQAQPNTPAQTQAQTPTQDYMLITDNQIVEIMRVVNQAEIQTSQLAASKATNPQVKEFATQMLSEHKKNMNTQKELVQKANMKPEPNKVSQTLQTDAKTKMTDLKAAKGTDFDRRFMNIQVAMHQKVHDDLTQRLIPNAKNPQLKVFLQTTEDHIEKHLARAKEIQASVTSK